MSFDALTNAQVLLARGDIASAQAVLDHLVTVWTDARAAKQDLLDTTISSRAQASSALSNTTWTDARAALLDLLDTPIGSRAPASTALSNATWTDARAARLDKIGIKSIQRGIAQIAINASSVIVNITAVNPARSIIIPTGWYGTSANSYYTYSKDSPIHSLISSTQIEIKKEDSDGLVLSGWQVVEYY